MPLERLSRCQGAGSWDGGASLVGSTDHQGLFSGAMAGAASLGASLGMGPFLAGSADNRGLPYVTPPGYW